MKIVDGIQICLLLLSSILPGSVIEGLTYDYNSNIECVPAPNNSQYEGGMVVNSEFDKDLEGWDVFNYGRIEVRTSLQDNKYVVAYNRTQTSDSFTQRLYLEAGKLYTFSAWLQISEGSDTVVAVVKTNQDPHMVIGAVTAKSGCWSMLKGGLSVNSSGPALLHFESNSSVAELWADSISLQPFTKDEWRQHQLGSIDKIRKRNVRFHIANDEGKRMNGARVILTQTRPHFPLGCATADTILTNQAYQNWFISRFKTTTFDNEMKWYYTEKIRGQENYSVPDAMMDFAKQYNISVRGHNILWDKKEMQPKWALSLNREELGEAATNRVLSVMSRYAGQVIGWDVMNENLHYTFFEEVFGPDASAIVYRAAQEIDHPNTTMFMNEYNTLEHPADIKSTTDKYLRKLKEIKSFPYNNNLRLGIGLESHFDDKVNIPYIRSCLDTLGATSFPIWLTELDVMRGPNQAQFLEEIMTEGFSHPSVEGIIVWAGWKPTGCSRMCLTDNDFKNLAAGDVVDKLIQEWTTNFNWTTSTTEEYYEYRIFHGEYEIEVANMEDPSTVVESFNVAADSSETLDIFVNVI